MIPEWKISTSLHSHSFSTNIYKYFLLVLKDIHIYMCMYAVLQVFVYSKIGQTRCYQVLVLICLRSITKLRKKYISFQRWPPCHLENNFPPQASHHACSSYTSIPLPSSFTLQLFMYMLQINTLHVPLLESWVLLAFAMWTLWCLYCRSMFSHQEPCVLSMGSFSENCKITRGYFTSQSKHTEM